LRVILDTNVLISGIFFSGPPYQILKAWQSHKIQLVISTNIYNEYRRVADLLKKKYKKIDISSILNLIATNSDFIDTQDLPKPVCEDPDDDKFIASAISGKVKIIVSGDKHLLKLSGFNGIVIIKPKEFVDNYIKDTPTT
jgi:putative PIN family toxin of toxin-antitoxin system